MARNVRALLVLGRVSNLPTVWSNCLAAWLLGGGGPSSSLILLCLGATLMYSGGMFLNDAWDVEFDRKYRPERPIVSGQLGASFVWVGGSALLALGWACLVPLGREASFLGLLLAATIVLYDAIHKRTSLAPVLMAACRFLLYLTAAAAAVGRGSFPALWPAAALAAYVLGLSFVARRESTSGRPPRWPIPFLFVPIALALVRHPSLQGCAWVPGLCLGLWISWCLLAGRWRGLSFLPGGVAGLLAGIALVDWLAASATACQQGLPFAGLFLLALLLQRVAPAT